MLVSQAVALAEALAHMVTTAAAHHSVADTGPRDVTEKPQEVLQDSLLAFPEFTF